MSISRTVYEGPCFEYPGFVKEISWINHTDIYITINKEDMQNEAGWRFKKVYKDYHSALDSLSEYLKVLKEKTASLLVQTSLNEGIIEDSLRRLREDVKNKSVFLPDNGVNYKYY